jgi:hypothetical protein
VCVCVCVCVSATCVGAGGRACVKPDYEASNQTDTYWR